VISKGGGGEGREERKKVLTVSKKRKYKKKRGITFPGSYAVEGSMKSLRQEGKKLVKAASPASLPTLTA